MHFPPTASHRRALVGRGVTAYVNGDKRLAAVYRRRFRPEFVATYRAWDAWACSCLGSLMLVAGLTWVLSQPIA